MCWACKTIVLWRFERIGSMRETYPCHCERSLSIPRVCRSSETCCETAWIVDEIFDQLTAKNSSAAWRRSAPSKILVLLLGPDIIELSSLGSPPNIVPFLSPRARKSMVPPGSISVARFASCETITLAVLEMSQCARKIDA